MEINAGGQIRNGCTYISIAWSAGANDGQLIPEAGVYLKVKWAMVLGFILGF